MAGGYHYPLGSWREFGFRYDANAWRKSTKEADKHNFYPKVGIQNKKCIRLIFPSKI